MSDKNDILCKNCYYYWKKKTKKRGECRRYAPNPSDKSYLSKWAITSPDNFCGEFLAKT